MNTKKFIVMTVGRSGSTSLMDCLEQFDDIALPNKNIECVDNELVHPIHIKKYIHEYSKLTGIPINSQPQLIESFYEYNANNAYAGFKSMPNRHPGYNQLVQRHDIQFISLIRRDIASTVSSFMIAMKVGSWRRYGEKQTTTWRFDKQRDANNAISNISYNLESLAMLKLITAPIALEYEDLCDPSFNHAALNDFFGRTIRLNNPKPPTSGSSYVENWDEFSQFVNQVAASLAI